MAINIKERFFSDMTPKKKWIIGGSVAGGVLVIILIIVLAVTLSQQPFVGRQVLSEVPLIDGHNDLPNNFYQIIRNDLSMVDLRSNLSLNADWIASLRTHTDLPRLKEGQVGGQFWVAYAHCETNYKDAVARTLQQIDVIKRMINAYSDEFELVTTSEGILDAFIKHKKIASLIGVEGGHAIDSRMAVLRLYYELGVRYLTLTHNCELPWANSHLIDHPDNATVPQIGLTDFGKDVIAEMNRLGMMVDLSHTSKRVMNEAISISNAPVIFSHSSAAAVHNVTRNVDDDTLRKLKDNGGIIMVSFYNQFISLTNSTISKVIEHIEHIRTVHGNAEHIGIGSDFDGINTPVQGLDDVSKYPVLFDQLAERGWSRNELKQLAGENLIRVFKAVETVRDSLIDTKPYEKEISVDELRASMQTEECRSDFTKNITSGIDA